MVQIIKVEGFDAFMTEVAKHKGKTVFAMFSGSKDSNGKSWCPDCVVAEPILAQALQSAPEDIVYIYCGVGARDFWKDKGNIFRTHDQLKLKSVPTLMKWGTVRRLEEADCAKLDLVTMMFED